MRRYACNPHADLHLRRSIARCTAGVVTRTAESSLDHCEELPLDFAPGEMLLQVIKAFAREAAA
jgi:hypothetical protein